MAWFKFKNVNELYSIKPLRWITVRFIGREIFDIAKQFLQG